MDTIEERVVRPEPRRRVRDFIAARLGHPKGSCRFAVHLSCASPFGHTLVDVALYLPKSWTEGPARRLEAGVPDTVGFTQGRSWRAG